MPFWRRAEPENPETVRRLREAAGLSRDEMAERLGTSRVELSAWESGALAIPPMLTEVVRYEIAMLAHTRAREAAGVAECSWCEENADRLATMQSERGVRSRMARAEILRHQARCPECLAKKAYDRGQPPPEPPSSLGAAGRLLRAVLGRLPRWLRPVPKIAGLALVFVSVALLVNAYKWLTGNPVDITEHAGFLEIWFVLSICFAAGDTMVERIWDRAPALAAALLAVITVLPLSTIWIIGDEWSNAPVLMVWTVVAAIIGGFLGWHWSQPPKDVPEVSDEVRFIPHSRATSISDILGLQPAAELLPRRKRDSTEPGAS